MRYLHVYKEMTATYSEIAEALKKLGFKDLSTDKHFRYINTVYNSEVKLPFRPLNTVFSKANLAGYSYQLYMQGVIEEQDDLAKLIEKNRLTSNESVTA